MSKFQTDIIELAPFLRGRNLEIRGWNQIKLLTVTVERLNKWYREGLLCIGDAAHAMSPIGGVGINLAIADAVATANILIPPLRADKLAVTDLKRVQRRRELPTKIVQRMQIFIQDHVIFKVLNSTIKLKIPWPLLLLREFPLLRRIPARMVGLGFRPEHVQPIERLNR